MNKSLDFWKRLKPAEKDNFSISTKLTKSYISSVLNGNDDNHVRFSQDTANRFLKVAKRFHNGDSLVITDIPHEVKK